MATSNLLEAGEKSGVGVDGPRPEKTKVIGTFDFLLG